MPPEKQYPQDRQNCGFAVRYLKWVHDSGAAVDIGPEGVSILNAVVLMEDQFHYRRAVNFYNEQLATRAGFRNVKTMDVARSKAVAAGLLHYQPSMKRQPGVYWVLSDPSLFPSNFYQGTGRIAGGNGEDSGVPPYQVLPTKPTRPRKPTNPKLRESSGDDDSKDLASWITFWNSLKARELVVGSVSETPSQAVRTAWNRAKRNPEVMELLKDRSAIERAIERSGFVRKAGWFRLEKLLGGKNKDGELIVRKLLEQGYEQTQPVHAKRVAVANTGPGVVFDKEQSYASSW